MAGGNCEGFAMGPGQSAFPRTPSLRVSLTVGHWRDFRVLWREAGAAAVLRLTRVITDGSPHQCEAAADLP